MKVSAKDIERTIRQGSEARARNVSLVDNPHAGRDPARARLWHKGWAATNRAIGEAVKQQREWARGLAK